VNGLNSERFAKSIVFEQSGVSENCPYSYRSRTCILVLHGAEGGAGSELHLFLRIHTHVPAQERAVAAHCEEHDAHVELEKRRFRARAQ